MLMANGKVFSHGWRVHVLAADETRQGECQRRALIHTKIWQHIQYNLWHVNTLAAIQCRWTQYSPTEHLCIWVVDLLKLVFDSGRDLRHTLPAARDTNCVRGRATHPLATHHTTNDNE